MWIMIAGPYQGSSAVTRASNLRAMNLAAVELFRRGHVPVIGVNLALPMIEAVGSDGYDEIMMPLSLAATERCDAILRIGGPSNGADDEVRRFVAMGKPVYGSIDEVPAPSK